MTEEEYMVLVTGGAGFIGSHLVDRLVCCGYGVRVVDDLSSGKLENIRDHVESGKVEFVEGDIRDVSVVERCVKDVDVAVHLAALISVPFSVEHPKVTFDVNVTGTLNLLRACAEAKVERFVFASSCAVYGEPEYLPVDEKHPTNPISPYAESKLAAEQYCLGFNERDLLSAVVLRFFNVYGVGQAVNDYSGVITKFIERCREGLPLVIYGDGSQTRDFVNVSNVVDAILLAMEKNGAEGEIFNVGFGRAVSVQELAETVLETAGVDLEIRHDKPRLGDIKHSYADVSKAEKLLGYRPTVSLKAGLRKLLSEDVLTEETRRWG